MPVRRAAYLVKPPRERPAMPMRPEATMASVFQQLIPTAMAAPMRSRNAWWPVRPMEALGTCTTASAICLDFTDADPTDGIPGAGLFVCVPAP